MTRDDSADLVAENERLRAEVDRLTAALELVLHPPALHLADQPPAA